MRAKEVLFVETRAEQCHAVAWLNGLPIANVGWPGSVRDMSPVLHLSIPRMNRLELEVLPATPRDPAAPADLSVARALARLVWLKDGDRMNGDVNGQIITELRYPPPSGNVIADARSARLDTTVDLADGECPGPPAWLSADVTNLSSALLDALEPHFHNLANAIERGAYVDFAALWRPYLDDYARAYPEMGPAGVEAAHRGWLDELAKGGARVTVAPRESWMGRLVGGGRLVDVRDPDGAPVITIEQGDGLSCAYPALVGLSRDRPIWTR